MENELIEQNINIAYKIACTFFKTNNTIELEDLKQIALIGLIRASRTFKKEKRI